MTTDDKNPEGHQVPKKKLWIAGGLLLLFVLLVNASIYFKVLNYGP